MSEWNMREGRLLPEAAPHTYMGFTPENPEVGNSEAIWCIYWRTEKQKQNTILAL